MEVATTGKYTDKYGNETILSENSRKFISKYLITPSVLYNMGLLPAETGNLINKVFKQLLKNNELTEEEQDKIFDEIEEKLNEESEDDKSEE